MAAGEANGTRRSLKFTSATFWSLSSVPVSLHSESIDGSGGTQLVSVCVCVWIGVCLFCVVQCKYKEVLSS